MITDEQTKLDEIENLAFKVLNFISVTKNACEINNYCDELTVLEYALVLQNELITKILDLNMSIMTDKLL